MVIENQTKEYATLKQFELLKKFKAQGTLQKKMLTRDLWLTNRQALELGYDVPKGEDFLLSPTEKKVTVSKFGWEEEALYGGVPLPPPEEPTVQLEGIGVPEFELPEFDISKIISRIYSDKPDITVDEVDALVQEDPDKFLDDLIARGRTPDTENLLRVLGQTEEYINLAFTYGDIPEEGQPYFYERMVGDVPVRTMGTLTPDGIDRKSVV